MNLRNVLCQVMMPELSVEKLGSGSEDDFQ